MKIAILPGDGIGTEIVAQALRVMGCLDLRFETEEALVGGAAYEAHGHPLPEATLKLAQGADALCEGKLVTGRYFMERVMPETAAHLARISSGADTMMALPAEAF